ncbi:hypothetical protein EWF20_06645 [Sulfolobus sp. S-194]|uniref:hypothetical protein n=1 Tax=Sulfolobus sp. S-194 TaxID=2512240 RepID=UPI00143700D4|nr:hypothetical protein [Sulfolobus sp. S-194]QIW23863.1 hypothetical protein EWF20_06645 [Sulfolobus sp. S-194]
MLRLSHIKLYSLIILRKKRFIGILLAFIALSIIVSYLNYLSLKEGYDYVPYEDLFTITFNFIVISSILFAGDLVSEDFGSNVKYILLQLGGKTQLAFSKYVSSLIAVTLTGYIIPIIPTLVVISVFKGLPNLEYVGILYLYVIAYTSLNSFISALFYDKGSKLTLMINIVLWEIVYFVYTNALMQVSSLTKFYYTSLPVLAEGLYLYYNVRAPGFSIVKPNVEYSVLAPIIVSVITLVLTYLRVKTIRI